jgi:hypothetical protein
MLGGSDRLRIIGSVLELTEENFLERFAKLKKSSMPKSSISDARESVSEWWAHRRDPVKDKEFVIQVLQACADEQRKPLKISELWLNEDCTPGEFALACGTSLVEVADVLSPILKRSCFEQIDKFPFLRMTRRETGKFHQLKIAPGDMTAGVYDLYRFHSTQRELCLELLEIGQTADGVASTGTYIQYRHRDQSRTIDVSFLTGGEWLHTIGAYVDQKDGGNPVLSLVHLTIITSAWRDVVFGGILHDVFDNKAGLAAQRILLVKRDGQERPPQFKPTLLKDISDTEILRYVKFLRNRFDQLAVSYGLMAEILELPVTTEDRLALLS